MKIACKYCGGTHIVDGIQSLYYGHKVFGGWVSRKNTRNENKSKRS
jgi:hypothetical protein